MIKSLVHKIGSVYAKRVCRSEFESQRFRWVNERPVEYSFMFSAVGQYCPESVLDVGTGKSAVPSLLRTCGCCVTAIDNVTDYWTYGMVNRHWHIVDDDICNSKLAEKFDLVTCISVLEHIEKFDDAILAMCNALNPGGHLIVTCPYNEKRYVKNAYALDGSLYGQDAPYPCQVYSRENVSRWCELGGVTIELQEYWKFFTGEMWTQGEIVRPPKKVQANEQHQHSCMLFRKGDDSKS